MIEMGDASHCSDQSRPDTTGKVTEEERWSPASRRCAAGRRDRKGMSGEPAFGSKGAKEVRSSRNPALHGEDNRKE